LAVKSFQATPAFCPIREMLRKLRAKRSTSVPWNHNRRAESKTGWVASTEALITASRADLVGMRW
jgi:hypothetical protein